MALAFSNATVVNGSASAHTVVFTHTAAASTILFVYAGLNENVTVSSVVAGGVGMTRLGAINYDTDSRRSEMWILTAPGTGVLTISADLVGAGSVQSLWGLAALTYTGHKEVGPIGDVTTLSTGAQATGSVSASSSANTLMISGWGHFTTTSDANLPAGTERAKFSGSATGVYIVGDLAGSAGAQTMIASSTAVTAWGIITFNLIESAVASSTIVFDNAGGTGTTGAANIISWALTATSGAVLLVWTSTGSGAGTVSAVAANGVALTELGAVRYRSAAPRYCQLWGLTAPGSGVLSISAVVAAAEVTNFVGAGVTYVGHRTTATPFGGVVTGTASAVANTSLVVSASANHLAVVGFSYDDGDASHGAGTTVRFDTPLFPAVIIMDAPGAASVTASVTTTAANTYYGGIGINLIASESAAGATTMWNFSLGMLGVGR